MVKLTSARSSLLESTVATDGFCPLLLCYHYSNVVVATVAYDPFLHWCVVVVLVVNNCFNHN
jgi:hypothetical protein